MNQQELDHNEEFWRQAEERHGSVLGYGLVQYFSNITDGKHVPLQKNKKERLWGLGYITALGFFFYRFPQQSWISGIIGGSQEEEMVVEILAAGVLWWRRPQKGSVIQKLLGKIDERLIFATRQKNNTSVTSKQEKDSDTCILHSFLLDYQRDLILHLVQELFKNKERIVNITE